MAFNMNVKEGSIEFPAGLRVLVIDDDPHLLASLLRQCQYHVTCAGGAITEEFLLVNKNKFDLAIVNVDMPEVDGFMLIRNVELQMDLPVIMLSSHDDKELIMKGINHGACHYLNKPDVRIEELNKLWIRVARRKKLNFNVKKYEKSEGGESGKVLEEELNHNNKRNKKRKEIENEGEEKQQHSEVSPTNNKKTRLVWEKDLQQKFIQAVDQLGIDKAVPKKILELMNDKRLSRDNVASHLQKYRFNLRKDAEAMIHQENMNHSSSYPPARALTRSNTVEPELNTYNTSTRMIEWHQPSDHNMIINVDPISTVDPRLMQQNNWPRPAQPISYHHDQAPLSRFNDHNAPTPYGFNDHNAPTPLNDFIHHNVLTPSSGFNGHYAPTPSNRFNNHNVPPSSGFNGHYASTPPNGFNDHNAPTPSSGFNDHNALTPPNGFNNHNAPTPNGFNDHNAPTAHHINQTYFQGNTFGVPYQEADDQFFQGFEFHANDEVFHYAPKK